MKSRPIISTIFDGAADRPAVTVSANARLQYRRDDGVFAIMFAPLLILIVAACGLALNAGALYNRKVELSGMAKAVALAAAQELNGTTEGIAAAKTKAKETAQGYIYSHGISITWQETALTFSMAPARIGDWRSSVSADDAGRYYFAKVDTSALDAQIRSVALVFPSLSSGTTTPTYINDIAIAGRSAINVPPIAICAMSENATTPRTNNGMTDTELVEYGFRRGVSYDLMRLNPKATTPARFLVDAASAPGMSGSSFDLQVAGPFVCTGSMWMPGLKGGSIHVSSLPSTSPLESLYTQLNSRFDDYAGDLCSVNSAPPDTNIMAYQYDKSGGAPWMVPSTGSRAAMSTTERSKLETVADIPPPGTTATGVTAGSYGPLWAYTKAAKYAASEPSSGYATFLTSDWAKLYASGLSATGSYQSGSVSPYNPIGVTNPMTISSPSPARKDFITPQRRVLNVPLLSCTTVPSGSNVPATVKGIGKFFMTVPATKDALIAEFAGTIPDRLLTGPVELYP